MSNFILSARKRKNLEEKMRYLGINERDITEKFIRSSGRGGQNVNKVSTCVYLKHIPSGVEVKCGRERSQAINRFLARVMLAKKLDKISEDKKSRDKYLLEKKKRQGRKRSRKSKAIMLENKRKRSEKKALRRRVEME